MVYQKKKKIQCNTLHHNIIVKVIECTAANKRQLAQINLNNTIYAIGILGGRRFLFVIFLLVYFYSSLSLCIMI